jgi:hypothetical protein
MEKCDSHSENEIYAKLKFSKFAKADPSALYESEFYECLENVLAELKSAEWLPKLKDENYFQVFLKKGGNTIDLETFTQVMNELKVLSTPDQGDDNGAYDIDVDFGL